MKNAALISSHRNNSVFDSDDKTINRDGCSEPFVLLKETFERRGVQLNTSDLVSQSEADYCLYLNYPRGRAPKCRGKAYLLAMESEVIVPENWNPSNQAKFRKIFTWFDGSSPQSELVKLNFSANFPAITAKGVNRKEKLCVVIAGNKKVSHRLELYSEREKTIRWFERHHPKDFDLYGMGWNEFRFSGPRLIRALNRFKPLVKLLAPTYPSYRGAVASKREVLQRYWFSICYENARDIPGYITEKIFDCFFAGCVPIYWGANNITDHIPPECFIDRREFETHEALYHYLVSMSNERYQAYLDAIEVYLESEPAYPFTAEYFAETIVNEILGDE
ncbi:glycosyltransferase family 10 domain-containing protein [Halothiobacillus sp.]|uniref:glycosyltransferase family 10 domain-containing protein n=1 Tax=Halothiobacillus sp. TaxID=1891311 RepID=UPI002AD311FD|nr:glycosyltransferase family 10 [Halothiobacillus sp.]